MTAHDLKLLLPLVVSAGTALVILLALCVRRSHRLSAMLALAGLAASTLLAFLGGKGATGFVAAGLVVMDNYARLYMSLIFAASFAAALLAYDYFKRRPIRPCPSATSSGPSGSGPPRGSSNGRRVQAEEFYALLMLAATGAAVLTASRHFVPFFLGLEILSVSLYAMIAYERNRAISIEAGVKYLILAATSAAMLVFGMALVYAECGSMEFSQIGDFLAGAEHAYSPLVFAGLALMITGIGFKLALVPFHMWTPDIYQGAPAPVTAFVATVSKGAVFALLLRFFVTMGYRNVGPLLWALTLIAIFSMFAGNLLALLQQNVKRMLAYSSIANLGYLLVAFLAGGMSGAMSATYFLIAYFVATLGAWAVVTILSDGGKNAESFGDYRGLMWRRPVLAAAFTAMLLSLAGIPLTAGFIGKFFLLAAGVSAGLWILSIMLAINSVIGLFYYVRLILVMSERTSRETPVEPAKCETPLAPCAELALVVLTVLVLWVGINPASLLKLLTVMLGRVS